MTMASSDLKLQILSLCLSELKNQIPYLKPI